MSEQQTIIGGGAAAPEITEAEVLPTPDASVSAGDNAPTETLPAGQTTASVHGDVLDV